MLRNLIPLIPFVIFIALWLAGELLSSIFTARAAARERASARAVSRLPHRSRGRK
ncbi:hypothetical protein [Methylocystis parvus]|uniref:hypothetical protein n=1 Tax=Methylocystis parvus TaxID=134 RepID=UPI003C731539